MLASSVFNERIQTLDELLSGSRMLIFKHPANIRLIEFRTLESGFLGFDLSNNTATSWDDKYKDVKFSMTRLSVVGQTVADSLSPSLAPNNANQSFYIRDATICMSTLLAALERQLVRLGTLTILIMTPSLRRAWRS